MTLNELLKEVERTGEITRMIDFGKLFIVQIGNENM